MRIATWNVNSLKAHIERVEGWLAGRSPDVPLMPETKLADEAAPEMAFGMAGYDLLHHGEGRWNGHRQPRRDRGRPHQLGDGPVRRSPGPDAITEALGAEASEASVGGGVRVVSLKAPNGRGVALGLADRSAFDRRSTCATSVPTA
ncbi:MAG: hypothetical protein ABSG37_13115 [Candidatus Limnocylindrales bacterium]|jgi:exodeoxyribonuclease-3